MQQQMGVALTRRHKAAVTPFFTELLAAHAARLDERQSEVERRRKELLALLVQRGYGSVERIDQLMAWLQVKQAGLILRPC